jgi:WD40 repeat protein/energy-coupling factor transporter ATP-binding protein EcfA2
MSRAPFVGLRPFDQDDAPLFFGRDEQIDEVLERLETRRFLAVVGLSGSGKSSLVQAGLIPALYRGELETAGSHWRIAIVRPSRSSIEALAQALGTPNAAELLRSSSLGLVDWTVKNLQPEETLLVLVDQFEEIFRDGEAEQTENDLAFVRLLLEGSVRVGARLIVVITIRADFLGYCGRFRGLPEAMNQNQYLVSRLSRDQIGQAIAGPVEGAGARITPALVTQLINDTGDDPTQLPVLQHALMRLWEVSALDRAAGKEIGLEHYRNKRIESLNGAIDRHAKEIMKKYESDPERRRIVRILFQRITGRKEGGQLTRRRTPLSEIWEVTVDTPGKAASQEHQKLVNGVVEDFRAESVTFLSPRFNQELKPDSLIDISHETLMLHWKLLRDWIDQETKSERLFRRFAQDAADHAARTKNLYRDDADLITATEWAKNSYNEAWAKRYGGNLEQVLRFIQASENEVKLERIKKQKEEDDKRERARIQKFLWKLITAAIVAALVLAAATVAAISQRNTAVQQTSLALSRQLMAEASEALHAQSGPELSALLAIESIRREVSPFGIGVLGASVGLLTRRVSVTTLQSAVTASAFSPDGSLLAIGSRNGHVSIVQVGTGKKISDMDRDGPVTKVQFSEDGLWLASVGGGREVDFTEIATGKVRSTFTSVADIGLLGMSKDAKFLTTATVEFPDPNLVQTFDTEKGLEVWRWKSPANFFTQNLSPVPNIFTLSADGGVLAWASDQALLVVHVNGKKPVTPIPLKAKLAAVDLSPNGGRLMVFTSDGTLRMLDLDHESKELWFKKITDSVKHLEFSADGNSVILTTRESVKMAIKAESGELAWSVRREGEESTLSPDGRLLATRNGRVVRVFDTASDDEISRIENDTDISTIVASPRHVAIGSANGKLQIFEAVPEQRRLRIDLAEIVSPDRRWFTVASKGTVRVVQTTSGREVLRFLEKDSLPNQKAFSFDSSKLAWLDREGLRVFDVGAATEIGTLPTATSFAFSPDSRRMVIARVNDVVIFELNPWHEAVSFSMNAPAFISSTGFSPNNRWVKMGAIVRDSTTKRMKAIYEVFEADTGLPVSYPGYGAWPASTAFSGDGRWLAAGDGKAVVVFSITRPKPPWPVHWRLATPYPVTHVSFSPDSQRLAAEVNNFQFDESGAAAPPTTSMIYTVEEGRMRYSLDSAVTFSPHNRWAVTREGTTARFYDAATGNLVTDVTDVNVTPSFSRVQALQLSPATARLFSSSPDLEFSNDDQTVWFVDHDQGITITRHLLDKQSLIKEACSLLVRNLSAGEWKDHHLPGEHCKATCPDLPPCTESQQTSK